MSVVDVTTDATQRMQSRRELEQTLNTLRESESSLRALLESAEGFVVYRVAVAPDNPYKGRVVLVSPSIVAVLGLEDPYDFESWFSNIHPDDMARVVEANRRSLEAGVPYDQSVRWYHPQKEEWIWIRTISTPLLDDAGRPVHSNGLMLDITERVRAQETLEAAHEILEQRVEERTREVERRRRVAEGLRHILAVLNSRLSLEEILHHVVAQSSQLLGSDAALIYRLDAAQGWMVMESEVGLSPDYRDLRFGAAYPTLTPRATVGRQLVTISDIPAHVASVTAQNRADLTDRHLEWFGMVSEHFRAALGVPVVVREELYGGLVFYYRDHREFSEEDLQLAMSLGDQAALAIGSARLHAQVEQVAVVRERERLARELHDSVTQSLYSVTLLAEAGQRLAGAGDLDRVRDCLSRLGDISRQALKEMRLLVYELRPLVLRREGLVGALRQRLDAVERRAGVDAHLLVDGEVDLPAPVEETLYRVAQEALNNALKHAAPTVVTVHIRSGEGQVEMEVIDNGQGFDLTAMDSIGGMGLVSMRERVEGLGGQFSLHSTPGAGARVKVVLEVRG